MAEHSKILVVDDEAVIRELMWDILAEEGYPVEAVSNGRAALDLLQKFDDFVLLFTDIMMPEMDGIQLIREARKLKPTLIPIVMTGFATLETARAAVKEGAYDYVLKPFSLSEIKLAVANALERYHLANENARLREVTELFTYSEQVVRYRDEAALLDFVLKAALERVGAKRGSIMLTTRDGRVVAGHPLAYDPATGFGLVLPPLDNHPYFITVAIERDIDVAVVSPDLTGDRLQDWVRLTTLATRLDARFEVIGFRPEQFRDEHPLAWEVKTRGILVQ